MMPARFPEGAGSRPVAAMGRHRHPLTPDAGSAVQRRRQPRGWVGRLELADGDVVHHEIVPVR